MVMPANDNTIVQTPYGIWTLRAAAAAPQNVFQNLFTVATGNIWLLQLILERTVIQAGGASNLDFQTDPTSGAAVSLSGVVACTGDAVGIFYVPTGNVADAPWKGLAVAGGMAGGLLATGINSLGWIIPPGTIDYRESAAAGTGSNQAYALWVPIDPGATLVAA